ncbi:FG-GAP repeat protein [Planctomycetes bacterium CA13]|uniref:FG-GAP repeat protein n=1 Tax=Novipirellula herctigrandis TaxID=2527986 RepID=A0A5C5YUQ0_9BACT|nr:FG-GAP repeat protein [Planctomycetes bacterium CA13]
MAIASVLRMTGRKRSCICFLLIIGLLATIQATLVSTAKAEEPWKRHAIDNTLQGADGVKLGDFDGDGLQDVVTGWEESGVVRLYLNPGVTTATKPWPSVTVGIGKSPEDALPFDVDGDGQLDVISCHEGRLKQVLVHRFDGSSVSKQELLKQSNWKTSPLSILDGQQWMFASTVLLRGGKSALVFGSKNSNATLTILFPPTQHSDQIEDWQPRTLRACGWIMSIQTMDMDDDSDNDIVFSDRTSKHRCVAWLEQPDENPETASWTEHTIGATGTDPLFIDAAPDRVLVTTRQKKFFDFKKSGYDKWDATSHANPADVPFGKAIRLLTPDTIIFTANTHADSANTKQPGMWLKQSGKDWQVVDPTNECKFDRMELIDLDGDGDLDVMTCEERQSLGVVWYENPGIK